MKSVNRKYRVQCFLDNDHGRDPEILLPLIYCCERYLNCEVTFSFNFDLYLLKKFKPDIVLIPNAVGSHYFFEISKYAHSNKIPVFSMISEGNFRTDGTFNYWGYNIDQQVYEEFMCHWSQRTLDFLKGELPRFSNKMVLTGATGFDRYTIYDFVNKEHFLAQHDKGGFEKIIGYAGWAFGKLYSEQGRREIRYLHNENADQRISWMEKNMLAVEHILRELIEKNADTLFLLKRHPNEANPAVTQEVRNEMLALRDYPNVLYIKENIDVHDLISISDLWMAFESTTAMEFWLRKPNNPTILINPDPDFKRDQLFRGSAIARDYRTLQNYVNEFYGTGTLKDFLTHDKREWRGKLISETIGFGDGLNHIRAAKYFKKVVEQTDSSLTRDIRLPLKYWVRHMLTIIGLSVYSRAVFLGLPRFRKAVWVMERYKLKQLPILKERYRSYLEKFHAEESVQKFVHKTIFEE